MNKRKVNVQMLEPQQTNGIRTIDTTSSPNAAKLIVGSSETLRQKFREVLYKNSSDDTECLRIRFEKIHDVIDLLVKCVG